MAKEVFTVKTKKAALKTLKSFIETITHDEIDAAIEDFGDSCWLKLSLKKKEWTTGIITETTEKFQTAVIMYGRAQGYRVGFNNTKTIVNVYGYEE